MLHVHVLHVLLHILHAYIHITLHVCTVHMYYYNQQHVVLTVLL